MFLPKCPMKTNAIVDSSAETFTVQLLSVVMYLSAGLSVHMD